MQPREIQEKTVKALEAMREKQWMEGRNLAASTRDTLTSKIYYWMLFTKNDDFTSYPKLTQFIRQNPEWPGMEGLKAKAERSMPTDFPPADVVAWYQDFPPKLAVGVDMYMQALIDLGRGEEAKAFLADWWASTTLSRDDQRMIFRKYSDYLDRSAHLRRFDTMLLRGEYVNARALAQVLGAGYPELAEARIALAEENAGAETLIARVPPSLQRDAGFLYERLRWRRKHDLNAQAVEILNDMPPLEQISNPQDWWKERHILIRRLIELKKYKGAYILARAHGQAPEDDGAAEFAEAEWMAGWLALRFLHNPEEAYGHFKAIHQVVDTPMSKSRAAYWAGRAAEDMGNRDLSLRWYKDAAQYQTVFYGQLAGAKLSEELGRDYSLPHAAPPKLDAVDIEEFRAHDLVQAAHLLKKAGLTSDSIRFLKAFVAEEKTPKAYRYAAELAVKLGHLSDGVRISKEATSKGMFLTAQAYPVITNRLSGVDLEWALVHAIIRQESMFDFDARSPVGAAGLMQLMPATASETARKMGLMHEASFLTTNPDYNIQLGSKYLSDLVERYDGSYPLAAAAYNAGPGRVRNWLETFGDPRTGDVDLVDWIESIPVSETRNYVQRVMEGVYVYRLRLKGVQKTPRTPIHIALE